MNEENTIGNTISPNQNILNESNNVSHQIRICMGEK